MSKRLLPVCLVFLLAGCQMTGRSFVSESHLSPGSQSFDSKVQSMMSRIVPGERVAVVSISERRFGDITELGNLWRSRLEGALAKAGATVKVRQEVRDVLSETEIFGSELQWKQFGADILVTGNYRLLDQPASFLLEVKLVRRQTGELVGSFDWQQQPEADFVRLASMVLGNIHRRRESSSAVEQHTAEVPRLIVAFDRKVPCYPAGSQLSMKITSEPGAYIYIFNMAADGTVTLLHPNKMIQDKPLVGNELVFPPPPLADKLQLVVMPLPGEKTSNEAMQVVASREKLDFSFLTVPFDEIYSGARGNDASRLSAALENGHQWNTEIITYYVGEKCTR